MRTFGLGRMDCADCFKTENDWCPAIIVPLCTMNCGPAVFVNGVQLAEQAPRGSEANRIKWERLRENANDVTDFTSDPDDDPDEKRPGALDLTKLRRRQSLRGRI